MRGIAAAPNSPLDIMLGLVDPIDPIHNEIASKSKPRQTDTRAAPFVPLAMTASAPADGCTDRGPACSCRGYRCTSTVPLVRALHHAAVATARAPCTGSPLDWCLWPPRLDQGGHPRYWSSSGLTKELGETGTVSEARSGA